MKKTIDIHEKIAVRAYYAWLNGSTASAEADWLAAEQIERAYAERRAAAARKAAETRKEGQSAEADRRGQGPGPASHPHSGSALTPRILAG